MRTIPQHSTCSLRGGMWFVFKAHDHALALWISSFTGKEELYVNGELQATKRGIGLSSTHTVSIGKSNYIIALNTRGLAEGRFECTLSGDGGFVQGFTTRYIYKPSAAAMAVAISAFAVVTFAVLKTWLSPWYFAVPVIITGIALSPAFRGAAYVINEISAPDLVSDA